MNLLRNAFLKASESVWLREHMASRGFLRRAAARFLPGEQLEDALTAADQLAQDGILSVLTHLGENVTQRSEAEQTTRDYLDTLASIGQTSHTSEISVKLTQLGLDLDTDFCRANLQRIADASPSNRTVWVDMEHSPYVDATLEIYRRVHANHKNLGVCLQAYLFRTERDVANLINFGASVRLVKGAYNEPSEIALTEKREVDDNFLHLAKSLFSPEARRTGVRATLATHDRKLIAQICDWAAAQNIPRGEIEFQMLYGIQRAEQSRLARAGYRVGVLVSYGSYWFPWFMRRLAERPANAFFVARNIFVK